MDDLGNRTSVTLRDSTSDTYSVDTETNRYTSIDSASLAYDDAGNLTTDKDGYVYTYDDENRISQIKNSSDALIATFEYDALGRRVKVTDVVANTTTCYYYSDNWQVLAEYDDANNQQAYYVFGNYIDEVLMRTVIPAQAGIQGDYYYLHDHLYSAVALLNEAGSVVERYEYDAYGKAAIMDASYTIRTASAYDNPYTFTGRRLDTLDNGNYQKMHYRHCDYDTYAGRFFQHDPLGYTDGMNLYEYVASNSITNCDPKGTDLIAIADRPVFAYGREWGKHYSIQHWRCCNKNFKRLYKTTGYTRTQIIQKCGQGAAKLHSVELIPSKWKVYGWEAIGNNNGRMKITEVDVSRVYFSDTGKRIMPIYSGGSTETAIMWLIIKFNAATYQWAEHDDSFLYWPQSLYKKTGTNSNTFVRSIMGPYMVEMEGSHPGDFAPRQNTFRGWTFYPGHKPF